MSGLDSFNKVEIDNQTKWISKEPSVKVLSKEELIAALKKAKEENVIVKTIKLGQDITVDPGTIKIASGVTIDGYNHTLTVGGTTADTGNATAEGLHVVADAEDVVIRNLQVEGTHGGHIIEIYGSSTLVNMTATNGKNTGIYVNNDGSHTTIVNF